MPAVKRKYHYGHVVLSDEMNFPTKTLCGYTVPVLMKDGETKNIEFGGFVSVAFGQRIKIADIIAWTGTEGLSDWHDTQKEELYWGQYIGRKAFIVWPLAPISMK